MTKKEKVNIDAEQSCGAESKLCEQSCQAEKVESTKQNCSAEAYSGEQDSIIDDNVLAEKAHSTNGATENNQPTDNIATAIEQATDNATQSQTDQQAQPKKKSVGSIIFTVFTDILLVLAVLLFIAVVVDRVSGKVPDFFGYSFHVVLTGSMEDEIKQGDLIIVKSTDKVDIDVGDDILFNTDDPTWLRQGVTRVVHRVQKKYVEDDVIKFTTKGIANASEDPYPAVDVVGIVVYNSTFLGKLATGITNSSNQIFFVSTVLIMAVGAFLVFQLIKLLRKSLQNAKFDGPAPVVTLSEEEVNQIKAKLEIEMRQLMAQKSDKPSTGNKVDDEQLPKNQKK